VAVYDEQPELEITCDGNDPFDREIYQIFLNVWGNTKAFFEYWQAQREEQVRSEVPQQTAYEASLEAAWPRKRVHKCVLQSPCHKTRVRAR
jgi:hypothetical protein